MATLRREGFATLAKSIQKNPDFRPPAPDRIHTLIAELDGKKKLSETMRRDILKALRYLFMTQLINERLTRRGAPQKNAQVTSALIVRELVDEGATVKAAVARVLGKDATMKQFENLKKAYHTFIKKNPRKAK